LKGSTSEKGKSMKNVGREKGVGENRGKKNPKKYLSRKKKGLEKLKDTHRRENRLKGREERKNQGNRRKILNNVSKRGKGTPGEITGWGGRRFGPVEKARNSESLGGGKRVRIKRLYLKRRSVISGEKEEERTTLPCRGGFQKGGGKFDVSLERESR